MRYGRRHRRPFFSAATKVDNDRHRSAEHAANAKARDESGEAIQVTELLELGHVAIVTVFLLEGKSISTEKTWRIWLSTMQNYPPKNAMSLFSFVTAPAATQPNGETKPVDGTNNEAERTLRGPALARKTRRTNKAMTGAWRQTILTRVLESLRLYLPTFTFRDVVDEINRWPQEGCSCFRKLMKTLNLQPIDQILDRLFPSPAPTG